MGQTVKGADPHGAGGAIQHRFDAAAHLTGSLVGKCHGKHTVGRRLVGGQ